MTFRQYFYRYLLILVGYFTVGVIATYPLIAHLSTKLYGIPGDNYGAIWSFWWNMSHTIDWTAPAQPTLLGSAWLLGQIMNEVATYNLFILSGFALGGLAIYLIVRHFTSNNAAALLAGLIYVLAPYHIYQSYVHISLAMIAWLPFYFYALLLWLKDPRLWRAVVSGFLLAIVMLDNYYYGYFAVILTIFFVVGLLIQIVRRKLVFWTALGQGLVAVTITGLMIAPFIIPLFLPGGSSALQRPLQEILVFNAKWWDFFVPAISHPIFGRFVYESTRTNLDGSNYIERTLYIGYVPLALAIFGAWRKRQSWLTYLLLALLIVSIILATAPLPIASFLRDWFPTFRVYSRFGVLSVMSVAILSGIGIASISSKSRSWLLYLAIALFIVTDLYPGLPAPNFDVTTVAPYEKALRAQPKGATIIYPMAAPDELRNSEYLSDSRRFGQPLFNAITPEYHSERYRLALSDPTTGPAQSLMRVTGIRYIVIRKDVYRGGRLPESVWNYYDPEYPHIMLPAWNEGYHPDMSQYPGIKLIFDDSQAAVYILSRL